MTDDIVTRLRRLSERNKASRFGDLLEDWSGEAADEIEYLRKERDRWAKWGEHVFICPNKGINPCRDCVSPATADAIRRVDEGGSW
jgi:hypothetical protein